MGKDCMNMDYEELQEEQITEKGVKNNGGFFKGIAIGALGMTVVLLLFLNFWSKTALSDADAQSQNGSILTEQVQKKINELMGCIRLYFYGEAEDEQLAEGIYSGLLQGLDDQYSQYYTKEEYADLQISATQNYYGIGAQLSQDRDTMQVSISHVYEGSPAEAAGLKDGDIIVMVKDIEAVSMELSDLVTHIRGEEGTTVHLQIYREGLADFLELDVERANIDLPTIEHKLLAGKIGYIHILEFGAPTIEQFESAVKDLEAQGMQAMILDVRDNPGGMVTAVTGILDDLLPEGTVVYTQDKYGKRQNYSSDEETKMDYPLAVLMNGNSASASEILAGAIRDFEYGTLIGTKTFGKGIVQTIVTLEDGDAVKLTTAKYFTPNGENIHGTGIEPDVELEFEYLGDVNAGYDEMQDNQVQKAIEVLEKEISVQQ